MLPSTGANLELGAALEKGHSGIRFGGAVFGYVHQTRVTATIGPGVPQVAFAIGNHADGSERCRYNL